MNKAITGILLFLFQIATATGSIITFDTLPCPICNHNLSSYEEDGALFSGTFGQYSMAIPENANNGSTGALRFPFLGRARLTLTDGSAFSLNKVDLAEYSISLQGSPKTISFTGLKSDNNTTVLQSFTIDGLMDGPGGIEDFQRFSFSADFRDLVQVDISSEMLSIDNLTINAVPIPAAAWLFMSGLFGLISVGKRNA